MPAPDLGVAAKAQQFSELQQDRGSHLRGHGFLGPGRNGLSPGGPTRHALGDEVHDEGLRLLQHEALVVIFLTAENAQPLLGLIERHQFRHTDTSEW